MPFSMSSSMAFALISMLSTNAFADIYKWIDEDGKVHYGDEPPQQVEDKRLEIETAVSPARAKEAESQQRRLGKAVEESDRRSEARRARSAAEQAGKQERLAQKQACLEARKQLAVLQELRLPTYRDAEGKFRAQWIGDVYRGKRDYLDDDVRAMETDRARQEVASQCRQPDEAKAQRNARLEWILSEKCATARAKLEFMQQPRARATEDTIKQARGRVKAFCKE